MKYITKIIFTFKSNPSILSLNIEKNENNTYSMHYMLDEFRTRPNHNYCNEIKADDETLVIDMNEVVCIRAIYSEN